MYSLAFKKVDKNADGYVDKSEAKGQKAFVALFEQSDKNKDGKVSKDEYISFKLKQTRNSGAKNDALDPSTKPECAHSAFRNPGFVDRAEETLPKNDPDAWAQLQKAFAATYSARSEGTAQFACDVLLSFYHRPRKDRELPPHNHDQDYQLKLAMYDNSRTTHRVVDQEETDDPKTSIGVVRFAMKRAIEKKEYDLVPVLGFAPSETKPRGKVYTFENDGEPHPDGTVVVRMWFSEEEEVLSHVYTIRNGLVRKVQSKFHEIKYEYRNEQDLVFIDKIYSVDWTSGNVATVSDKQKPPRYKVKREQTMVILERSQVQGVWLATKYKTEEDISVYGESGGMRKGAATTELTTTLSNVVLNDDVTKEIIQGATRPKGQALDYNPNSNE